MFSINMSAEPAVSLRLTHRRMFFFQSYRFKRGGLTSFPPSLAPTSLGVERLYALVWSSDSLTVIAQRRNVLHGHTGL